jgi:hypothetical protein
MVEWARVRMLANWQITPEALAEACGSSEVGNIPEPLMRMQYKFD